MINVCKTCIETCPKGISKKNELLEECDSVFDALWEMHCFVENNCKDCAFDKKEA